MRVQKMRVARITRKKYSDYHRNHLTDKSNEQVRLINRDFCLWPRKQNSKKEMIIIPTGTGGVLYRPISLHPDRKSVV